MNMSMDTNQTAKPPTEKQTKDFNSSTIGVTALVALWISFEIFEMIHNGIVITRLSPAVAGGIVFADIPSGAQWLYGIGLATKYIGLLGTGMTLSMIGWNMSKGRIFTERNVTLLNFGTGAMFAYFIGRIGFEGLGNNFVASDLGLERWWDTGVSTPYSEFTPALILLFTLGLASMLLRRGARLKEDVDGLV
nr:Uncharacterised protein [Streptococcus thermophilus]